MKILLFTSNALRHKFVANTLAAETEHMVTLVECKTGDATTTLKKENPTAIERHFQERYHSEEEFFVGNEVLKTPSIPLLHPTIGEKEEINTPWVFDFVKKYEPDAAFVFGSSILREPLLSVLPSGKFINMHLGLSPYTRGSGTNFWPFITGELEYVGVTLLHIDPGVDTGDIIAQGRPLIEKGDTVHTVGNKTIRLGAKLMAEALQRLKRGETLPRTKQWEAADPQLYRRKDFNEENLAFYQKNMEDGLIEKYLNREKKEIKIVTF